MCFYVYTRVCVPVCVSMMCARETETNETMVEGKGVRILRKLIPGKICVCVLFVSRYVSVCLYVCVYVWVCLRVCFVCE